MFLTDASTLIAETPEDVPSGARPFIDERLLEKLGGNFSEIFPDFSQKFPGVARVLDEKWPAPKLVLRDKGRAWLVLLLAEGPVENVFFDNPYPPGADEDYFDLSMLPISWESLFRSMSSFTITSKSSYSPLFWRNTLLPQGLDVRQFQENTGIDCSAFNNFVMKLGVGNAGQLKCWMTSDRLDSFWINGEARDRSVYYVHGGRFDQAKIFDEPGVMLDSYLAYLLEKKDGDFDFQIFLK